MSRDESRRALLQSFGPAVLAGVAGCLVKTSSENTTEGDRDPNPDPGGSGGDDDSSESPGSGGDDDSGGNQGGQTGRTFSIQVENGLTSDDLAGASGVAPDEPAGINVRAARSVRAAPDEVLFERELELPPGESRTFEDALTTEVGQSYTVSAKLEQLLEEDPSPYDEPGDRTNTHWEEGGFGGPEDTRFRVVVSNLVEEGLRPKISVY